MTKNILLSLSYELARLRSTTTWSLSGLRVAWLEEKSLRQWVGANVLSWIFLVMADFSITEAVILVALGSLIVVVELINSSVEAVIDYISTDRHPKAKKAKDIASAAVMIMAFVWFACWTLVATYHLLGRTSQ